VHGGGGTATQEEGVVGGGGGTTTQEEGGMSGGRTESAQNCRCFFTYEYLARRGSDREREKTGKETRSGV
jgi:hypothetical protein